MNGETGIIILWIVIGFFGFVTIICGTLFYIFWRRRKLTFLNFLSSDGKWEKIGLMPDKVSKNIDYQDCIYEFDIKKCTHDKINRPIAHYYKGNPKQQIFDYSLSNKNIEIGTENITQSDFITLIKSKVIKDIFSDDEVMMWLLIIFITVLVGSVIIIICILAKKTPPVILADNNQTIDIIARGVRMAITQK